MAYPRARLLLLLLPACSCFTPPPTAALSFSYNFSRPGDLDRANLNYIKDSSPSGGRRAVDLTIANKNGSTGRVLYSQPVRLWDDRTGKRASFNTSFSFAIGGGGGADNRGDGMAFFVGPFRPSLPPDSGGTFLGLFTNPATNPPPARTVGVEFDTCWNQGLDPPDARDGPDHIGIDVNSISSKNYTKLQALALSGTMSANITYDGGSKIMSVRLQLANGSLYSVEAPVDLRDAGVPRDAAVGFSAATGDLVESHQLLSWSFYSTVARKFSYHRLCVATDDFSLHRKLGAGNFGEVYRGDMRVVDAPVAVKRLTLLQEQTRRDYVNEIMILGQLRHRNLVKLVGWCDGGGDDKLLLVYELVTNGSLDDHLHGSARLLTWPERYRIVIGVGAAIEYLHTGDQNPILHRDIKPSNVMLDDDFVAKLGDFGLVRQVNPGQGSLRGTAMVGSWEYMDPRCITTCSATPASDMYSFGVLLLEIATGRRPRVLRGGGEAGLHRLPNVLADAVRESYGKGAVLEMADARLNGDFDRSQMERVLLVGLLCVQEDRRNRPGIREAVDLLSNPRLMVPEVVA